MAARLSAIIVTVIVGATLIAGLMVGAQRDDADGPIDVIIHNGRVYTSEAAREPAEAVAIRGNQILRVGSNREVKRLRRPQTIMIDAEGGSVVPGFNDTHVSLLEGALALDSADLSEVTTAEELDEVLGQIAKRAPDGAWIVGRAWRCTPPVTALAPRLQLDRAVPDKPAYVACVDGRTAWANSAALHVAGITRRTPSPAAGTIGKDLRSREPTGVLKDAARAPVLAAMPARDAEDRVAAIRAATALAHRHGVTSVHDVSASPAAMDFYDGLRRAGELKLRIYAAAPIGAGLSTADLAVLNATREKYLDDPLLRAGAVHLVVDGIAPPHPGRASGAAARRADPSWSVSDAELGRLITLLDAQGWQIIAEASSKAAVSRVLDAFDRAARTNPVPPRGRRHRIERIDAIAAADAERAGVLGIMASLQPARSAFIDGGLVVPASGGDAVPDDQWPWVRLKQAKAALLFGSDWPALSLDPLQGLLAALSPPLRTGEPEGAVDATNASAPASGGLTLSAALDAYTANGAHASFDDHRKGRLASGMLADVVILSKDIFTDTPERLAEAVVRVTIFDGKVVYRRPRGETTEP